MRGVFFDPNGALFQPYDDDLQSNLSMRGVLFNPNGALFQPYDDDLQSNFQCVMSFSTPTAPCFDPMTMICNLISKMLLFRPNQHVSTPMSDQPSLFQPMCPNA